MNKLFYTILLILVFAFYANAITVNLSDYANLADNDASIGFQAAIDAVKAGGGGEIIIDANGTYTFRTALNLITSGNYISYKISGNKSTILKLNLTASNSLFNVGNANQLELKDLIFIGGESGSNTDVNKLLIVDTTNQTLITGCLFYGIMSANELIRLNSTNAVISYCQFGGNATANKSQIYAVNFGGLKIINTTFLDYANLGATYYSKTPFNVGYWIIAENTALPVSVSATNTNTVHLDNVIFDEGAKVDAEFINISNVFVTGVLANMSSLTDSTSLSFNNVPFSKVEFSGFGYISINRAAIKARNNSIVYARAIRLNTNVVLSDVDATSRVIQTAF